MTVSLGLSEPIVDAIVKKLKDNMPSRLAVIRLEKDDGIEVEAPKDGDYYTAAVRAIGRAPAILVMDGRMGLQSGQEGPHGLATQTRVGVYVLEEESDEQRLARKLQRQTRAVIESLWDSEPQEQLAAADGSQLAWRIIPAETVPGPAFEPEGDGATWRQFYLTVFLVSRFEG